jgi:phosphoribosyl 1,2-cyclic phosphodiesterase
VPDIRFQVWGCRGGRNTHGSQIGNFTSCYSLRVGTELFVFDAGRGLGFLAEAVFDDASLRGVSRVHVLVTHAHMDHWEGLKDAAWLWRKRNGLDLTLIAPAEALDAIRRAHEPPSFVPLEVLAEATLARLTIVEIAAGAHIALPGATLHAVALHHYSGAAPHQHFIDTLGYHLVVDDGPAVAYLSDHEPTATTNAMERGLFTSSQLAVVDANYAAIAEHAFGHGSIEHAAALAREHPSTVVLASHHGPLLTDAAIEEAHRRYGCANLAIAAEGNVLRWDAATSRFVR